MADHPATSEVEQMRRHAQQFFAVLRDTGHNYVVIYPNNDLGSGDILAEIEHVRHDPRFAVFPSLSFERFLVLLKHALQTLAIDNGVCVLLQPTSLLRRAADVAAVLDLWQKSSGAGSVVAMTECEHHPYKVFIQTHAELSPVHAFADMESPRQVLPPALRSTVPFISPQLKPCCGKENLGLRGLVWVQTGIFG